MRDVYIDTLRDLNTLYPSLYPCTEPSKTTEHGKNTYTLFNSIEDNFTTGCRAWRIAKSTVAFVVAIFPGLFIPFIIPGYWDWIAESWNEGYTGIDKISIYVLPMVLEEYNKKEEPETEKPMEEVALTDATIPQPSRQAPTESTLKDTPMEGPKEEVSLTDTTKPESSRQAPTEIKHSGTPMEGPKEEVSLTDTTKPESSRQAPTESKHTGTPMKRPKEEVPLTDSTQSESSRQAHTMSKHIDSPMKVPYGCSDSQKSHSSQRNVLNSNITKMSTRPKINNNQVQIVESREALSERFTNLAFNPPQGCTKEVQDKLMEISADMLNRESINVYIANLILELDLLAPNALTELDDYSLAL